MINKGQIHCQKVVYFLKKHENSKFGKHACQNMVAMVTSSSVNNDMSDQIFPR